MTKALINIDYTRDFVDGALPVGEPAIQIEKAILERTKKAYDQNDYIVFAIDLHDKEDHYHPESSLFPEHNIRNTQGRELYGQLRAYFQEVEQSKNVIWIDKTRYSAFAGTNLDMKLRERNIREIELVGVCTDICILHTAIDAYNLGYSITVYEAAAASFNSKGHEYALEHIQNVLNGTVVKRGEA